MPADRDRTLEGRHRLDPELRSGTGWRDCCRGVIPSLFICLCVLHLSSCAPRREDILQNGAADAGPYLDRETPDESATKASDEKVGSGESSARNELFLLPESDLRTQCAAADYYPDGQVHPRFYDYPSPPEYELYLQCLLAEARRDGGRRRKASASSFPKVGTCYPTRIIWISSRFGGDSPDRDAGPQVRFDIGLKLVDYSYVAAVARSRVGDKVRVCVHDLPKDCPGDDLRGIGYRTRNSRTGDSWIMGDSQHLCRGA